MCLTVGALPKRVEESAVNKNKHKKDKLKVKLAALYRELEEMENMRYWMKSVQDVVAGN